jgi:hypothetical protein
MTVYELREILQRAGIVTGAILTTWNTQATYAANNDWTALYKFKRKLKRDAD